jgi:adenylate kinase
MKLVFLGPPGAGKGTLAKLISRTHNIPHLSTGEMFREEIKNETELGKSLKDLLDKGNLAPDELTINLIRSRISIIDNFILDGFPRTIIQAQALEKLQTINAVINLVVTDNLAIKRLLGRETCKNCGSVFHLTNIPPKLQGICDNCGGPLYTRADDAVEAITTRINIYRKDTKPLVDFYQKKKLLVNIDSSKSPEDTFKQVERLIFDRSDNEKIRKRGT